MNARRTALSLAVYLFVVTGCGASAQRVAQSSSAGRFYDARLLASRPAGEVWSEEPSLEVRLAVTAVAPASMQSLVKVTPHPDNRLLRLVIDGADYYRSSDTQLEGADAARHHFFTWQSLPPGTHSVVAVVYGPVREARPRAERFEVIGGGLSGLRRGPSRQSRTNRPYRPSSRHTLSRLTNLRTFHPLLSHSSAKYAASRFNHSCVSTSSFHCWNAKSTPSSGTTFLEDLGIRAATAHESAV